MDVAMKGQKVLAAGIEDTKKCHCEIEEERNTENKVIFLFFLP